MRLKKVFAGALAAAMLVCAVAVPAFAAEEVEQENGQSSSYVQMNIPYADFYKAAGVDNASEIDAVTSATKNKTRAGKLAAGSYHVNADGTDITGVSFPVKVLTPWAHHLHRRRCLVCNGLKYATKSGDGYTFSAAHTGTGSGVAEAAQKAADGLTVNLRSGSDVGSFGEFIRVDLNGNYGELGSRMQSVMWTYYGDDSTYTHAKASYGTKFAADNWMHKSMGIQLGLSDSARCQLPEGTDGTGYWAITIRALGYADTVVKFQTTAENLAKHELASDADRAALQERGAAEPGYPV